MAKNGLASLVKNIKFATKKYQPEILTGIGIAGFITTTIMAVKATPKALDLMAEVKEQHAEDSDKKAFAKDVVTKVAPVYIPATIVGGLSVACLIGASTVNFKRNAALATAYTLSESALKEYQDKVVATIGEKKEQMVRDEVAKEQINKHPFNSQEIIITEKGETTFLDPISGRYFKSDIEKVKKIANELNRRMLSENYISLNEFYIEVGLPTTDCGDLLGWNVEKGYIDLDIRAGLTPDNEPCIVLGYSIAPFYHYDR